MAFPDLALQAVALQSAVLAAEVLRSQTSPIVCLAESSEEVKMSRGGKSSFFRSLLQICHRASIRSWIWPSTATHGCGSRKKGSCATPGIFPCLGFWGRRPAPLEPRGLRLQLLRALQLEGLGARIASLHCRATFFGQLAETRTINRCVAAALIRSTPLKAVHWIRKPLVHEPITSTSVGWSAARFLTCELAAAEAPCHLLFEGADQRPAILTHTQRDWNRQRCRLPL
mmetsp:Transcript_81141/g.169444  ORF Transcript_81141/g.169444 Transcript_81141/m.169444 type:complete len:228 (-) Transcript_81141:944-1627(-)